MAGFPFEVALAHMRAGHSVRRRANAHLPHKGTTYIINGVMVGEASPSGLMDMDDLLATDWEVIPEKS